ncbi:threonine ammonia-lyase [Natronobiforma cellulositropha]|uniref:threonine ammonia-lyase n=1 Tax=Natronobiforma cellulositropha TaxID=1679076 RepID=UPI0021D59D64|nr:threonine/serine dehydratase [Natronobiforma cellulositropha]
MTLVSRADVERAAARLEGVAHRTPVDRSSGFAARADAASLWLKLENTQRTGSFKIRGAYNCIAQLSPAERARGVVTASAGNHAQGVALAGALLDVETVVVVPTITPAAKIAATRGYGAEVLVEGDIYERSYERALEIAADHERVFVHPFDDERIIAGGGTVGLEVEAQVPEVDTVVVAVGGGGLISGVATALEDDVRVVGVQPTGAAHAARSLERGEIYEREGVDTVADGIADTRVLERTFAVMTERVDEVVSVTDREIAAAVTLLAERAKTVAEPAGAAPLAAVLGDALDVTDEHVVVVVSGGNVDLIDHAALVRTGLGELGRYATVRLALETWSRTLGTVLETLERTGVEIDDLRTPPRTPADEPNRTPVVLSLEGSGREHLREALAALESCPGVSVVDTDPPDLPPDS